jgi:hypothetical protein
MYKKDYKIGSFEFVKEGISFNYAQVCNKKGEIIRIFLDPKDNNWYLLDGNNTLFNVVNLNKFVEGPYYQYKKDEAAKEALEEFRD